MSHELRQLQFSLAIDIYLDFDFDTTSALASLQRYDGNFFDAIDDEMRDV